MNYPLAAPAGHMKGIRVKHCWCSSNNAEKSIGISTLVEVLGVQFSKNDCGCSGFAMSGFKWLTECTSAKVQNQQHAEQG